MESPLLSSPWERTRYTTTHRSSVHHDSALHGYSWYIAYYFPALTWIRDYQWSAFPGDLVAGLTLASFQIPICLSYATSLAKVKAINGLLGLVVPPLVYALLGTVPPMLAAPESALSLVMGQAVNPYLDPGPKDGRSDLNSNQISGLITGSVGAIVLLMGLLRVGFLESIFCQSMLRGFITGVGIVMIVDQIPSQFGLVNLMHKQLGLSSSSYAKLKFVLNNWKEAHTLTLCFSLIALVAILGIRYVKAFYAKKGFRRAVLVPDILLVVIVSTIVCDIWNLDMRGLDIVGKVKPGKLQIEWMLRPRYWKDFKINFESAFFISILGFLESTVAARAIGARNGVLSANRELVALGTVNVVSSLVGALPSFGGYGRSKLNILSGGTTQVSSIVVSLVALLSIFFLMDYLYFLPKCVLSSIISVIGMTLLVEAPHDIEFFWRVKGYTDISTIFMSLLASFFWSVEAGVALGAGFALMRVINHATRPRVQILARPRGYSSFVDADDFIEDDTELEQDLLHSSFLVVNVPEPLTFANTGVLDDRLDRIERHRTTKVHPGKPATSRSALQYIIFSLKGMTEIDPSAASILLDLVRRYIARGVPVLFCEILPRPQIHEMLDNSMIMKTLRDQNRPAIFDSLEDAISSIDITDTPD